METKRWLWFILTSSLVLFGVDAIVIAAWQRFVRKRQWNHWLYRVPWILAGVFLVLSPYVSYQRTNVNRLEESMFFLFAATTMWYLPKIPIAIVVMLATVLGAAKKAVGYLRRWLTRRQRKEEKEITDSGRRQLLGTIAWSSAVIPFGVVGKGFLDTDDISIYEEEITLDNLPRAFDGLRIVQISDIHAGSWRSPLPFRRARAMIEQLKPDVLVLTGDFVNFDPKELELIRADLERLRAELGVFGSLGNHDHYNSPQNHALLRSMLVNSGIRLLVNTNAALTIDGETLYICGTDNTGLGQNFADLPAALVGVEPGAPTILLAHDPTFWDKAVRRKAPIDLMLSGHTHGGQVGIHILGVELSVAQVVYKQWAGLYRDGKQYLYVNRGLGTVGPPVRIGIPPEITVLTLRSPKPQLG
ncbi:MAG: metallophosphoesterase [Bacteroidota bacterium]|nr:metallophosphoesterase [Candidatus Kapabacteria bacterium]MCS7301955.1 metallophosphoesterase [Candidatus Kapabacteria bacterium]MCX7936589.1 metallophosphoesterase [Chlorobiota bacterium]MDW8074782.1 metallophosphoesterase [Bacteroidota bacterium]MDW8271421.1 metallophosphoesterase [Bacteroidota bacterium]